MRVASFRAGDVEVIIAKFGAESFASLLPNINRWRNQAGLEPVDDPKDVKAEDGAVGRFKAKIYDFIGPSKRLRVGVVLNGPDVWYFKIQGSADAVASQLPAFEEFLLSVRLDQSSDPQPQ